MLTNFVDTKAHEQISHQISETIQALRNKLTEQNALRNIDSLTDIQIAALFGEADIIKFLVSTNQGTLEDLITYRRPQTEDTILVFAVSSRLLKGVQYLLTIPGIKTLIHEKDEEGLTPLHWAAIYGYQEIVDLLRQQGATTTPKDLVDFRNENGGTLLKNTAILRLVRGIKYLLTIPGMKTLINEKDEEGLTPLHWAAICGYEDIIDLLRSQGAATTSKDLVDFRNKKSGDTLLTCASLEGTFRGVTYLLAIPDMKNFIHEKDKQGLTVLHKAAINGESREVIIKLLEAGADLEVKNDEGYTSVELGNAEALWAIYDYHVNKCIKEENNEQIKKWIEKIIDGANFIEKLEDRNTFFLELSKKITHNLNENLNKYLSNLEPMIEIEVNEVSKQFTPAFDKKVVDKENVGGKEEKNLSNNDKPSSVLRNKN